MNTAGSPAQAAHFLPASNASLWTRLGRALAGVFATASKSHAGPAAAAASVESPPVRKRSTISSCAVLVRIEVLAPGPVAASARRPGLPARWKDTHRVVINHLD